nr:MAG TPA: transcriptional regulator [Caudoviricetes sp.]
MKLFDVSKYEIPDPKNVDLDRTKYNVGVFLTAYLSCRSRIGEPREPKITSSFSIVPPSFSNQNSAQAEQILIQKEELKEEFNYLHDLFLRGYSSIQHPFKPEIANRRKKIFYDRYIHGLSVYITAERNHVSEDLVSQESSIAIVQFASALELLQFR